MHLSTSLQLKQQQKLIITPQLHQAIMILQLTTMELANKIEEAIIENPVLEKREEEAQDNEQESDAEVYCDDAGIGQYGVQCRSYDSNGVESGEGIEDAYCEQSHWEHDDPECE